VKERVRIEDIVPGDIIGGRKVVEVLRRPYVQYVRIILEGGERIISGYEGAMVDGVEKVKRMREGFYCGRKN